MARHVEHASFEDSLGCLSYCAELDADLPSTFARPSSAFEECDNTGNHHCYYNNTNNSNHDLMGEQPASTPLYFCLSPNCITPSESAADHPAVCARLDISGTLCRDHETDTTMPPADYPLEKFPAFDPSLLPPHSDLERQVSDRSQPLPRPASCRGWAGRYQATLWFLSTRPRDSLVVLLSLLVAFVAFVALALLIFLMVADAMGQLGMVIASVDRWLASVHGSVVRALVAFAESQGADTGLALTAR